MIEEIPDEDLVHRQIDSPHMWSIDEARLIDSNVFQFPSSGGEVESLVWSKYKPTLADVHAMGCEKQGSKRAAGRNWTYIGAMSAAAGAIRSIRTVDGHGFKLDHAPEEGSWHVHVAFAPLDGVKLNRPQKVDLKEHLLRAFGGIETHTCA